MFYSSFIVGFEELVKNIISKENNISLFKILNGAIITKSSSYNNLKNFSFLNNHFFIIKYLEETDISNFINKLDKLQLKKSDIKKSFRIIISDQNNLISVDNNILSKLENKIEKETGNYVNRIKPDIEYWILKRSEGIIFFMERINKHKSFDKQLKKGELREDLCYFLNYLSNPSKDDIFLDCFCGSGAIIKERIKINKYNMIFGVDIIKEYIQELKKLYKGRNNIIFKNINFFENKFENNFITKIVTDPPWGNYENIKDLQSFYQNFIDIANKILKPKGILILLTACKEEMNNININLKLMEKYDILVSGKKASVYVFKK